MFSWPNGLAPTKNDRRTRSRRQSGRRLRNFGSQRDGLKRKWHIWSATRKNGFGVLRWALTQPLNCLRPWHFCSQLGCRISFKPLREGSNRADKESADLLLLCPALTLQESFRPAQEHRYLQRIDFPKVRQSTQGGTLASFFQLANVAHIIAQHLGYSLLCPVLRNPQSCQLNTKGFPEISRFSLLVSANGLCHMGIISPRTLTV
jgi:hypothetical protein